MDENGIITGKIPGSGSGIHKTYEESIIRYNQIDNKSNPVFVLGELS